MHEKLIEMLLTVQMDDLNDAKMLLDYADQAKLLNATALANNFATRAKYRINNVSECETTMHNMLREDDEANSLFATLYHKFVMSEQERLKKRIDSF